MVGWWCRAKSGSRNDIGHKSKGVAQRDIVGSQWPVSTVPSVMSSCQFNGTKFAPLGLCEHPLGSLVFRGGGVSGRDQGPGVCPWSVTEGGKQGVQCDVWRARRSQRKVYYQVIANIYPEESSGR